MRLVWARLVVEREEEVIYIYYSVFLEKIKIISYFTYAHLNYDSTLNII